MRAVADHQTAAQSMGISVKRVFAMSWCIAAVVSSIGGILIGKVVVVTAVTRLIGRDPRTGLAAGLALAHMGEFSFVLALAAKGSGLIGVDGFQLISREQSDGWVGVFQRLKRQLLDCGGGSTRSFVSPSCLTACSAH